MQLPRPPYLVPRLESRDISILKARKLSPPFFFFFFCTLLRREMASLQEIESFLLSNTPRNFTTRLICRVSNRNDLILCITLRATVQTRLSKGTFTSTANNLYILFIVKILRIFNSLSIVQSSQTNVGELFSMKFVNDELYEVR